MSKSAPRIADPNLQRALDQVYHDINEIMELLSKSQTGTSKMSEGEVGAIRVVKINDNDVRLAVRSEAGWFQTGALTLQENDE